MTPASADPEAVEDAPTRDAEAEGTRVQSGRRVFSLLVCYDIVDDDIRADVARVLEEYGPRVQLSTFEAQVRGPQELDELTGRLGALVDPVHDQIRIYNFGSRPPSPRVIGCRTVQEWSDFIIA